MLLPAIPEIMRDFNIPYSTSAWIFSAYLIVAACYDPNRRQVQIFMEAKKCRSTLLVLYVVGVVAGGFSNNITFLLASRVIQGLGMAAVPVAFSILRYSFPPEKLAMPVAVFSLQLRRFSGGLTGGSQHNPEFWMACHVLCHSPVSIDCNICDCQICS